MANVSSVPRVKAALLVVMRAALPDLDALGRVTWAHPGADIQKEAAFMADAEFESEAVAGLRTAPRFQDETYTVPVWVDVLADGNDCQTSELRMWTIVGAVEDAIRADQSLADVTGLHYAQVSGKQPQNYMSDQAWASRCRINVKCYART